MTYRIEHCNPWLSGSFTVYLYSMKGRGALSNPKNRFLRQHSERLAEYMEQKPATEVRAQTISTLINQVNSPDVPFSQSINPFHGCEHGCIYCFARPKHAYLDLSPGLDFETKLFYKENAEEILLRQLSKPGYRCQPIALGTNTDPYQPLEKRLRLTRKLLQIMYRCHQPVAIITKGGGILRDLDLLAAMAEHRLVSVMVSLTSLRNPIKRSLEPRAASPATRLKMIQRLSESGIPVGVLIAPVIPKITDHELEALLTQARRCGANTAGYVLLRLPLEVAGLFEEWLTTHFPDSADAVLNQLRSYHEQHLYRAQWGIRQTGSGSYADILKQRFALKCRQLRLNQQRHVLNTEEFISPAQLDHPQLTLF